MAIIGRVTTIVALGVLLLPVAGCHRKPSRPIGTVRGKVTLDEAPVGPGTIIFDNAAAGVTTAAPLQSDGTYTVRTYNEAGLPVGHYRVAVSSQQLATTGVALVGSEPRPTKKAEISIPQKYRRIDTSPLTAEVQEGDNPPFLFRLEP